MPVILEPYTPLYTIAQYKAYPSESSSLHVLYSAKLHTVYDIHICIYISDCLFVCANCLFAQAAVVASHRSWLTGRAQLSARKTCLVSSNLCSAICTICITKFRYKFTS